MLRNEVKAPAINNLQASGQLHAAVALRMRKDLTVSIEKETGWAPEACEVIIICVWLVVRQNSDHTTKYEA